MDAPAPYLITLGRLLLAPVFIQSGIAKIFDYAGTENLMEAHGLPGALLGPTIALEVLAGLLILLGLWTRCSAIALAIFCLVAAVAFHFELGNRMQMIQFLENICMAGGLFVLAGAGSGALALDNLRR
jgi:putative oxidoreductase